LLSFIAILFYVHVELFAVTVALSVPANVTKRTGHHHVQVNNSGECARCGEWNSPRAPW